jgi:hypothetical protein
MISYVIVERQRDGVLWRSGTTLAKTMIVVRQTILSGYTSGERWAETLDGEYLYGIDKNGKASP